MPRKRTGPGRPRAGKRPSLHGERLALRQELLSYRVTAERAKFRAAHRRAAQLKGIKGFAGLQREYEGAKIQIALDEMVLLVENDMRIKMGLPPLTGVGSGAGNV